MLDSLVCVHRVLQLGVIARLDSRSIAMSAPSKCLQTRIGEQARAAIAVRARTGCESREKPLKTGPESHAFTVAPRAFHSHRESPRSTY